MEFKKPNVLVAGFPKCGSTFFYHLLKQHQDIYIPQIKELNYFNKDNFFLTNPEIINPRYFKPQSWYYSFFKTSKKVVMDFSILSALDVGSARRAMKQLGDIKIIFITRDKEKFLNSVKSFSEKEGGVWKGYKEFAEFEYYMTPYFEMFSKVMVVKLENLKENPQEEMNRVIEFLELSAKKFDFDKPRHTTEDYQMGFIQYWRRKIYFAIVLGFYKFCAWTVRAKIKAQGER